MKNTSQESDKYMEKYRHIIDIETYEFILKHISPKRKFNTVILESDSHINIKTLYKPEIYPENILYNLINIKRLNDVKYVNKILESSNEILANNGLLFGKIETLENRKQRLLNKFPKPLNFVHYFCDYILKRIFPKFKLTKRIYFFLTKGRNRVISEMEIYGRLSSCGFELIDSKVINGNLWFVSKKMKKPEYNKEATYGAIIKLNRVGKNNKTIKVYKFRTMSPYSEYLQNYIFKKHGLQSGGKFKNDPRVTSLGKFFRKFYLDELPMIYNVFKGDMKIVGVRPLSRHYLDLYPGHLREMRSAVKPGLIPPFYADLPSTLEEIIISEENYLHAYNANPMKTDLKYFFKSMKNIFINRVRSS